MFEIALFVNLHVVVVWHLQEDNFSIIIALIRWSFRMFMPIEKINNDVTIFFKFYIYT